MSNEDEHKMSDIDLVCAKRDDRNSIYVTSAALKQDPADMRAQQALHDAMERQDAIENRIAHRLNRQNQTNAGAGSRLK